MNLKNDDLTKSINTVGDVFVKDARIKARNVNVFYAEKNSGSFFNNYRVYRLDRTPFSVEISFPFFSFCHFHSTIFFYRHSHFNELQYIIIYNTL